MATRTEQVPQSVIDARIQADTVARTAGLAIASTVTGIPDLAAFKTAAAVHITEIAGAANLAAAQASAVSLNALIQALDSTDRIAPILAAMTVMTNAGKNAHNPALT